MLVGEGVLGSRRAFVDCRMSSSSGRVCRYTRVCLWGGGVGAGMCEGGCSMEVCVTKHAWGQNMHGVVSDKDVVEYVLHTMFVFH